MDLTEARNTALWHLRYGAATPDDLRPALRALLDATAPQMPEDLPVAPARHTDPRTSHEAAKKITLRAGVARTELLFAFRWAYLCGWDGLTAHHAVVNAGQEHLSSPWKRVSELKAAGMIEATGLTHPGARGMEAEVLAITPEGLRSLAVYCTEWCVSQDAKFESVREHLPAGQAGANGTPL